MAYDTAPKKKFAEDYIDVAERLRAWYDAYPNARIETEIVSLSDKNVVVKAWAYRGEVAEEKPAGTGHASMAIPGSTPYTLLWLGSLQRRLRPATRSAQRAGQ
jgi:hypothetical protein